MKNGVTIAPSNSIGQFLPMQNSNIQEIPPKASGTNRPKRWAVVDAWYAFKEFNFSGTVRQVFSVWAGLIGLLGTIIGAFVLSPVGGNLPESCTFYASTGLPCPGCGLTRSVTSYLHGEFLMGFFYHPLGIVFAVVFVFCAVSLLMPPKFKHYAVGRLSRFDAWVGRFGLLFVLGLLLFGITRAFLVSQDVPGFTWWKSKTVPPFAEHWVEEHGMPELFVFDYNKLIEKSESKD